MLDLLRGKSSPPTGLLPLGFPIRAKFARIGVGAASEDFV